MTGQNPGDCATALDKRVRRLPDQKFDDYTKKNRNSDLNSKINLKLTVGLRVSVFYFLFLCGPNGGHRYRLQPQVLDSKFKIGFGCFPVRKRGLRTLV
jgi:hypothetical protein